MIVSRREIGTCGTTLTTLHRNLLSYPAAGKAGLHSIDQPPDRIDRPVPPGQFHALVRLDGAVGDGKVIVELVTATGALLRLGLGRLFRFRLGRIDTLQPLGVVAAGGVFATATGGLVVPLRLHPVILVPLGAGEGPGPSILPGEGDGRDRLAAGGGGAAYGHEDQAPVFPSRQRVVATAQIADQGHVALAILIEGGDRL